MSVVVKRGNKWIAEGYYWDRKQNRRTRWRRSTGIVDDGTARNKRIAEQIAADISQSYAVGAVRKARPCTLKDAIRLHIEAHERAGSAPDTIDIVVRKAARLYEYFKPDTDLSDIADGAKLIEYTDHRRKMPGAKTGSHVGPGTIHREIRTLREAMVDAIKANRWEGTVPPKPELGQIYTPRENWLDKAQSQRVLLALPSQWRDHFVMYRQLGLDRAELYRIDPGDIDWLRNEVRVRGTKTEARDRILPLTRETRAILEARRGMAPMFPNWHNALRDLAIACVKANAPRTTLKDLRRSFATELAIAGVSPLFLKDLMGHSTTRMLDLVYARVGKGAHMHAAMASVSELRPAQTQAETHCDEYVPDLTTQTGVTESSPTLGDLKKPSKYAEN